MSPNALLLMTCNWHEFYDTNYHLGNINLVYKSLNSSLKSQISDLVSCAKVVLIKLNYIKARVLREHYYNKYLRGIISSTRKIDYRKMHFAHLSPRFHETENINLKEVY